MPLILESYESLPYIDDAPSQAAQDHAKSLVYRDLKNTDTSEPHPALPAASDVTFSELVANELNRIESGQPRDGGIDRSRYEEPDEPSADDDAATWRKSLRSAYISNVYLQGRHTNLALLEELGKNAWLVGNSQLDQILKSLDQELTALKEEVDSVNRGRKVAQEGSKGEILALEDTWRTGIGRLIEVQLATDQLRQETRQEKRTAGP